MIMCYGNNIWCAGDLIEEDIFEESSLIKITECAISQLLKMDCEVSQTIISLLEDAIFHLWKESNEAFLDDLHTLYTEDDGEMEWDYRTENGQDTTDVSSWLMQHDVIMKGVCGSCHGTLQHLGNITEGLDVTLRDNEEQSDGVQTACVSRGNMANVDNDSDARVYSSVEVTNCAITSNNLPPKCYPQVVDCATQTEAQTSVDRMWTGLADMSLYLNPMFTQLIKIGLQIPKALQW